MRLEASVKAWEVRRELGAAKYMQMLLNVAEQRKQRLVARVLCQGSAPRG